MAFAPTFEEKAQKFAGRAKFCKLNVDENELTTQRFEVHSIPTVILFKNGREVRRETGSKNILELFSLL